ncbi:tetratricopeptide repeat protein, partial [Helicobacter pylori]
MAEPTPEELFDLGVKSNKAKDYIQAKKYFEKACDLKYGGGCFSLGILYTNKDFGEKNYKKALALMTKGCELNYALECVFLGNLYTNNGPMVKKDLRKATQYYSKACELNLGVSCSL